MKCFFHSSDFDGWCSGAIVKLKYPECELHKINYGYDFPWDIIEKGETIFMVDFGLQPFSDMVKLSKMANLIWIDHHITAMNEYDASGIELPGLRRVGDAGCELTWEYLHPDEEMPPVVRMLGRFDVWKHNFQPRILQLQHGLRTLNVFPTKNLEFWEDLISNRNDDLLEEIIKSGEIIEKYVSRQDENFCKSKSFEFNFEGMRVIAVNMLNCNSFLFESAFDPRKHDVMMSFGYNGKCWTVSLYSSKPNIDVSIIAKKYGGGGHKSASGFQINDMANFEPFKKLKNF